MAQLSWRHHALIQSLLSRGPLPEKEFHGVFFGITSKDPVSHQQLFNDFLLKINKELAYVQFELRGCRNQYDGKVHYGVVNNSSDEHSKLGTKYSVPQIAFYKAVVEAIVQDVTNQGCIDNFEALNIRLENQVPTAQGLQDSESRIPPAFKSFSISQKEKTLNDLIQDRWLCYTFNRKIGLGVRSFLDLRSWFRVNEIPSCDICNEAGVKASPCPNEGCSVRMHDYCLKKKFSQRKVARVCPRCGTAWPRLGCGAEAEEANVPQHSQVFSNHPAPQRRTRSCKSEVVDSPQPQPQPRTQTQPPWGAVPRKRLRTGKAETGDAAEAGPSQPLLSPDRRTRRSQRVGRGIN